MMHICDGVYIDENPNIGFNVGLEIANRLIKSKKTSRLSPANSNSS